MYCKQVGLIVYMSMIGSFVPASKAIIGDFDRIFTRITSNDCISEGKSTFQLDLHQVADALNGSSSKSLLLIDEFGKGTLADDGQAILAALIRYFINMPGKYSSPHVYISTHFYEMLNYRNKLFNENESKIEYLTFEYLFEDKIDILNNTTSSNNHEINDKRLVFLYKIKPGITKSSFALNIAKQAGLPESITNRASYLLKIFLESNDENDVDDDIQSERNCKFHLLRTPESNSDFEKYIFAFCLFA